MSFAAFGFGMLDKLATNLSDQYGSGAGLRRKQQEEATQDYLKREREGIVARAEGAKAAGLHPLTAMQYQSGNSPQSIVGGSQLPNSAGYMRNDPEKPDPNIDRINAANARRAEAEADQAELTTHLAYRNLANQPGQPNQVLPTAGLPTERENLSPGGLLKGTRVVPNEILASQGGKTIGVHPGATEVKVPGYGTWTVPSQKLNESLEDVELLKYLAMLGLNRGRLWEFATSDVPWALGLKSRDPRWSKPNYLKRNRGSQPSRNKGGATGSW